MNNMILDIVVEGLRRQTFYQKNANTIHAGIGLVISLLSFLVTVPLGLPAPVVAAIPVAIQVLTTIGIKFTRNGIQPGTADALADAAFIVDMRKIDPPVDPIIEAERRRSVLT